MTTHDYQSLLKNAYTALEDMQKRLNVLELNAREHPLPQACHEAIAIVGMGCRLPGDADTPEAFWNILSNGINAVTEVPAERWNVDDYYDPDPDAPGKCYTRKGAFLKNVDQFDASFFRISPREAINLDPQQRLLLEVTWEALENAGLAPQEISGSMTGVFVGLSAHDYMGMQVKRNDVALLDTYFGTGVSHSVAGGRISYFMDWHGPNASVDTACSSSLVATHLACQSLRMKECEIAVAGGVNLILTPDGTISTCRARMMAFDGQCKTFDASADGYVRGEGCGIVVLKRLADALANGDQVLAVILGTAMNQDGRSNGLTAPNGIAQEAVIRTALADASTQPGEVSYIEAHGTGTSLGDPIEMRALNAVYGKEHSPENPFYVASLKTNIGHLEAASGIAGLIKLILCLQHKELPPHLNFKEPNPLIPWNEIPVHIPTRLIPWELNGRIRRVSGLSAFGFSGTNVHMIVAEAPEKEIEPVEGERSAHVLSLSARSPNALKDIARRYQGYLSDHPEAALANLCFTANTGRQHFSERLALVASSSEDTKNLLSKWLEGKPSPGTFQGSMLGEEQPEVAFLFTGQGSQTTGMGRQLYDAEPTFRDAMDQCDAILESCLERPLLSVIYPKNDEDAALIDQTTYTQPALFAIEYALARLWAAWGIEPGVVMGHSVGEYVAACLAGVFSLEDGLKLIAARGRLMQALPAGGSMAAVFASEQQVSAAIQPYLEQVSIGAINGPENTVISGAGDVVRSILGELEAKGIKSKPLTVSHAFHSPLMMPILEPFARVAATVSYALPQIGLVSNISGKVAVSDSVANAAYWINHIRAPVRFSESIQTLHEMKYRLYLEIGPQPTLLGMGRRCLPEAEAVWLPSIRPGREDWQQMIESLAKLYVAGLKINWIEFDRQFPRRKLALPTYPFQRQHFWVIPEGPLQRGSDPASAKFSTKRSERDGQSYVHPFLQRELRSPSLHGTVYESEISTRWPSYLNDHRFFGATLFPGTGFMEIGLAAAAQKLGTRAVLLENFTIQKPMILPENEECSFQVVITPEEGGTSTFQVFSPPGTGPDEDIERTWKLHCTGIIRPAQEPDSQPEPLNIQEIRARFEQEISVEEYYQQVFGLGAEYGPNFRGIARLWRRDGEAFARLSLPKDLEQQVNSYGIHPVLLDSGFHILGVAFPDYEKVTDDSNVYAPVSVENYRLYQAGLSQIWTHARLRNPTGSLSQETFTADLDYFDDAGQLVAQVRGLQVRKVNRAAIWKAIHAGNGPKRFDEWLYERQWRVSPLTAGIGPAPDGSPPVEPSNAKGLWLIFADRHGVGKNLADRLREAGSEPLVVRAGEGFQLVSPGEWFIKPTSPEDIHQLCSQIFAHRQPDRSLAFRGVIHLWGMDSSGQRLVPGDVLYRPVQHADLEMVNGSVLYLIQSLVSAKGNDSLPISSRITNPQKEAIRLYLVTCGAQPVAASRVDLIQASLWGLANTIASEHPEFHCTRIDLDPDDPSKNIQALFQEIISQSRENQIALRGQERYIARLAHLSGNDKKVEAPEHRPFELHITERGFLDNMRFRPLERRKPGVGEVEIRVRASGLNFRDVLNVMGMYPGDPGPVGAECAGVVVNVGEGVTEYSPGDEVVALAPGAFKSHVTASVNMVAPKPARMSFAEAVTFPIAFLTAYYGLHDLARIKAGDRVLIHAAAGGVGLAAVQLARSAGALVFATAGSPKKHAYLRSIGVEHIMSSRNLDFADQIMTLTGGEGVDIVLNSLADEFIPKSLSVLVEGGRFLEIGKRGIWSKAQVAHLNPTLEYYVYDLTEVFQIRPGFFRTTLSKLFSEFESGRLSVIPIQAFSIREIVEAFRFMAQARHIGKVVISQPAANLDPGDLGIQADVKENIRKNATYLITGGLGGLGLVTSESLVESGARRLVLMGRREPSEDAQRLIAAWKESGVQVRCVQGDVSKEADISRILAEIQAEMPPLRGVVHAAGVLDDGILLQQTWHRFEKVLAPKADGAWYLHNLTRNLSLDFFILFSSMVSILGSSGQGNYAAANAYLDALAHFRHSQGLPATSINWGPWSEVGMAAALGDREQQRWKLRGIGSIAPDEGSHIFKQLLLNDLAQVGVFPIDWNRLSKEVGESGVPPILEDLIHQAENSEQVRPAPEKEKVLKQLDEALPEDRYDLLIEYIQDQVIRVLGLDVSQRIDTSRGLTDLGMDSLMAVELSNRIEKDLKVKVPMKVIFEFPTIASLVERIDMILWAASGKPKADKTVVQEDFQF